MFKKAIIQTNDNLIKLENAVICYWNSCPDCFGFKTSGINRYHVIWLYVFVSLCKYGKLFKRVIIMFNTLDILIRIQH